MAINWPESTKRMFGKTVIQAEHTLHNSPSFCDASLIALLDAYPRERLGIWTFAEHGEGEEAPVKGCAPDLSGEELLSAVKRGRIWLNLRAANQLVDDFAPVGDTLFQSLQQASGLRVFKPDMGVLISSPRINVHYHLDIPMVALFQIRGEKTIWFYPHTEEFAPEDRLEAIALREQEEGLPFRSEFEQAAQRITLKPGMAVTWPQTAPHRVQNADCVNVSLSCEFMTLPALIKANAIYTNAQLRRQFGVKPGRPGTVTPATLGKAALARILKMTSRHKPMPAPTPASFKIDLTSDTCTRPLA